MKTLICLLLSTVACSAQLTNLTFTWNESVEATGYKFYEIQGTNRILIGRTDFPPFVVTNWNVSTSRTVSVTATNMLGESALHPPLRVPPAPAPVQNLKPIPLSIVAPVPSVIELSRDLVDWSQRIRLAPGPTSDVVQVTWVQYPQEPMMFMRHKPATVLTLPPMPTIRRPP